ncbi:hypothetical protein ScPMuIL_014656 [Solemya velum]
MGNKKVQALPGIGKKNGTQLRRRGIKTAKMMYGEFLIKGGNGKKFKRWLDSKCNANDGQQKACINALKTWHDNHQ